MTKSYIVNRFDQYDYQKFGLTERWTLGNTIDLLVDFHLEINGLHDSGDSLRIASKLYESYRDIFEDAIMDKKLSHKNVYNDVDDLPDPGVEVINGSITTLDKYELLEFLNTKIELKLDIDRMKRFLSGDELPSMPICPPSSQSMPSDYDTDKVAVVTEAPHQEAAIIPSVSGDGSKVEPLSEAATVQSYCFIKTAKGWDIQFEDAVLQGVKDWEGMKYIKMLLQNPSEKIDVIKMQLLLADHETDAIDDNTDTDYIVCGSKAKNLDDYDKADMFDDKYDDGNHYSKTSGQRASSVWGRIDKDAIASYANRITVIDIELSKMTSAHVFNKSKYDRLQKEKSDIQKHLDHSDIVKDPELDKSRKRILKNITEARDKIGKLESMCNYSHRPISGHLKRYIKTGLCCIYTATDDNLPPWHF